MAFIFLLTAFFITLVVFPMVIKMIAKAGFVRPNYRHENIPVAVGFIFVLSSILTVLVVYSFIKMEKTNLYIFLFLIFAMTLLGLLDDFFGSREASGLKGHFKKLLKEGELTTGVVKALAGGFIAMLISLTMHGLHNFSDLMPIIINTLIIALSTNAINLLDLRPGRATKGFLLGTIILTIIGFGKPELIYLFIIAGSVLAYMPYDLKAKVMMGDTGSNVLGVTLGITSVWILDSTYKMVYLGLLILFHLLTEKYSLTAIIEKNPVLRFLDLLGRK